jgi:hypothetical protein
VKSGTTVILIAAVAILAALALADALRSDGKRDSAAASPAATTTRPKAPTLTETLRRAGVSGRLLYSDQDCIVHSLLLPQMADGLLQGDNGAGGFHLCRFDVFGGRIVEEDPSGVAGGLSYRGGRIVSDDGVVLTHGDLVAAARQHPNLDFEDVDEREPLHIRVTGLARPTGREIVVAMSIRAHFFGRQFLAAIFRDRALVGIGATYQGPYRHLFVSAGRTMVGAEDGTVFMPDGRTVDPPQNLPTARAVAFSPDDRWVALVSGISVFLVATPATDEPGRIIRLPVRAQDLVWGPAGVGPGAVVRSG